MRHTVLLVALAACTPSGSKDTLDTDVDTDTSPPVADDLANPIVPEIALLPWPSDQYLVDDATTRTGRRISLPEDLLPEALTAAMFAADDGFTRVPPIVTAVPGGVDPASLPDPDDWGATTQIGSPVLLLRAGDFRPWPLLAEVDATADDPEQASLLLRPHRPLDADTTWVVLITTALQTVAGAPIPRSEATVALLADDPGDDRAMRSWQPRFELVREALRKVGMSPDDVAQAWTFTTKSEGSVLEPTLAMQDAAAQAPSDAYVLEAPTMVDASRSNGELASCAPDCQLVYGTLTVPDFLDADKRLRRDDAGMPVAQGTRDVPFLITVPRSLTGPRPVVLFGHGFFSAIEESTWGNLFGGLEQWQMAAVTTKFLGFAEEDLLESAAVLGGQLDRLDTIVAQQLQSHVSFTVLHRALTDHLAAELELDLDAGKVKPLDGTNVPYMGISNGGTQGLVLMTTSPVLDRGGLVVAGGGWSHMLQRAAQWSTLGGALSGKYADSRELQLAVSMLQQVFDPVDSLNYIQHLVDDRLPGRAPEAELLLVEAVRDTQVSNLVSRWVAGAAGFPLIQPSVADVWGLDPVSAPRPDGAPGGIGFEIYDEGAGPLPEGNVPPLENKVHDHVRLRSDYREQMGLFLETGKVVRTCDGVCDPE
ncbi:MAG: hypothetical protein H6732_04220 [Alphaproteobacteria bacterium]|nr:hypothetical protein [Alphaproteobacteria bacterium]